MPNHPNRPGAVGEPLALTAPLLIDLRSRVGLPQHRMAELSRSSLRKYQKWEAGEHRMPRSNSELLLVSLLLMGLIPSAIWIEPYISERLRETIADVESGRLAARII